MKIVFVSTSVFDTALNNQRLLISQNICKIQRSDVSRRISSGNINKWTNQNKLFLEQQLYGWEELYPSLKSYFYNMFGGELADVKVIHDPSKNNRFDNKRYKLLVCMGAAYIRLVFYPFIFYPIVYFMFILRIIKHLGINYLYGAAIQLLDQNRKMEGNSNSN